jgi:hypothetical protein
MSSIHESPDELPVKTCTSCDDAFQEVGPLCVTCAMQAAVDNDDDARAYDISEDFGRPGSAVRIMIRKRMEQRLRAEVKAMNAAVAALSRPVCKRCSLAMEPHDVGQWDKTSCLTCENTQVLAFFAARRRAANDNADSRPCTRPPAIPADAHCDLEALADELQSIMWLSLDSLAPVALPERGWNPEKTTVRPGVAS